MNAIPAHSQRSLEIQCHQKNTMSMVLYVWPLRKALFKRSLLSFPVGYDSPGVRSLPAGAF
jgi:hypothetical protein